MDRKRINSSHLVFKKTIQKTILTAFLSHLAFSGGASAITLVDQANSPYTATDVKLLIYNNVSAAGVEPWSLNLSSILNPSTNSTGSKGSIIVGSSIQKISNTIKNTPDGSVMMDVSFNYVDQNNKNAGSLSCNFTLNKALLKKLGLTFNNFDKFDNAVVTLTQTSTPTTCRIEIPSQ